MFDSEGSFLYGRFERRLGFIAMWNEHSLGNPESLCETPFPPPRAAEAHAEGAPAARPQPEETFSFNAMQRERVQRKGMEKRFCITLSLLCLDWKLLSSCPSRQPSVCWGNVPSAFLYRAEAKTVCYGRCQGTRQPTGRKVLFSKKKKANPPPPWAWERGDMDPIPSPVLILGGLGQVTLLTLFSSAWKCRMKCGRGVSLPAHSDSRKYAAHQELLAKPLMGEMGFVPLLQLPVSASTSVSLGISALPLEEGPKSTA